MHSRVGARLSLEKTEIEVKLLVSGWITMNVVELPEDSVARNRLKFSRMMIRSLRRVSAISLLFIVDGISSSCS